MNELGPISIISASRLLNTDDLHVLVSAMYSIYKGETSGLSHILKKGRGEEEVKEHWTRLDEYAKSRQPLLGEECSIVETKQLDAAEQALLQSQKMAHHHTSYFTYLVLP
jgi:hypothetical protein